MDLTLRLASFSNLAATAICLCLLPHEPMAGHRLEPSANLFSNLCLSVDFSGCDWLEFSLDSSPPSHLQTYVMIIFIITCFTAIVMVTSESWLNVD